MIEPPDKVKIIFQYRTLVDREQIASSKMDIIKYEKDKMAYDLAGLIMRVKQPYIMTPPDPKGPMPDLMELSAKLYVFTPEELENFIDWTIRGKR